MKKVSLSLALSAAIAVAMAATPSEAAPKKKAKASKPAVVTVTKYPGAVGMFHSCVNTGAQAFGGIPLFGPIVTVVTAVGCGVVYSGPVMVQAFLVRA